MTTVKRTTILAVTLGFAMALFASAASAGERKATRSWEGQRGGSVTKSTSRGGGTATRDVTRTGPNGKAFQRSGQRVVVPESQNVTRASGTDFPDGTSRSRTRTTTLNEDGTYSVQGERTNRAGETKSFSGTWVPE